MELYEDFPEIDVAVVPIGGGGLISGTSMALKANNPKKPHRGSGIFRRAGMRRSIDEGHVVTLDKVDCVIDGLVVKRVGQTTFSIVQKFVDDIVTLPDRDIFDAVIGRCLTASW